jgi:hypothetical protein
MPVCGLASANTPPPLIRKLIGRAFPESTASALAIAVANASREALAISGGHVTVRVPAASVKEQIARAFSMTDCAAPCWDWPTALVANAKEASKTIDNAVFILIAPRYG